MTKRPCWTYPRVRDLVVVAGADRAKFVHSFCTQEIQSLAPLAAREAMFLNAQGKILSHGMVYAHADSLQVVVPAGQGELLGQHLDRYVIRDDVQITVQPHIAHWVVCGPGSGDWVATGWSTGVPNAELPDLIHDGDQGLLRRVPYQRDGAFLLNESAWSRLTETQRAQLTPIGSQPADWLRIAAGWPEMGIDVDARNLPQELDRSSSAIHFQKGCYLGQETVARIDALGHVNQLLRGLVLKYATVPLPAADLSVGEKVVGRLTSVAESTSPGEGIALGYVRREWADSEQALAVVGGGTARVVRLPQEASLD